MTRPSEGQGVTESELEPEPQLEPEPEPKPALEPELEAKRPESLNQSLTLSLEPDDVGA